MDYLQRLTNEITFRLFLMVIFLNGLTAVAFILITKTFTSDVLIAALLALLVVLPINLILASLMAKFALSPLKAVWQAILHVSSKSGNTPAPNLDDIKIGRELVSSLALQVYQFASHEDSVDLVEHRKAIIQAANIVSHLPLPLFVFNKDQLVTNASDEAITYCGVDSATIFGKQVFEVLNLEFQTEHTLEAWILECQENRVTDTAYWERVRVRLPDGNLKQCDIRAYYNRDNESGAEFIVTLFDRTEHYAQDDKSLSFVAMAVHELRTPLTLLRGYIEVIQDELGESLSPELQDFVHKMDISAKQLMSFVNNILNVTKVEEDALILQLTEADWGQTLQDAAQAMMLRAEVLGKTIEFNIEPNLPTVAVDKVSITEVVNNLLDNALKYSRLENKQVIVTARLDKDGHVVTTVQDFGVGIPSSVVPNLFEKFYRNHRTKGQIAGTGLGLYLSKALVSAHGGQIWVESKEGQGSTFGFSLIPYSELAEEQKNSNNKEITRSAHGWIKNHSMYRR